MISLVLFSLFIGESAFKSFLREEQSKILA